MHHSLFFRLLKAPIEEKGDVLAAQIAAANKKVVGEQFFRRDPADFELIPGSPFAYWVSDRVLYLHSQCLPVESDKRTAKAGLCTGYDFGLLRLCWEIGEGGVGNSLEDTCTGRRWVRFAKGGEYSLYFADVHLVVNWDRAGADIQQGVRDGSLPGARPQNMDYYFRPALTWPLRTTSNLGVRALPAGCIFGHKGPSAFVIGDDIDDLLTLLAAMNSAALEFLVKLQLGAATAAARSYEVGVIQRTPLPPLAQHKSRIVLGALSRKAHDLQRDRIRADETSHPFCLPGLVYVHCSSLLEASLRMEANDEAAHSQLASIQAEIDKLVFDLYGLGQSDRDLVRAEVSAADDETSGIEDEDDAAEDQTTPPEDLPVRVQNLLMWCVGASFGRWDVRMALEPSLLPALQGPFDPLPRCAPGALVGMDGLPPSTAADIAPKPWLRARENVLHLPPPDSYAGRHPAYPLPVAWDGILVDDPGHPADIVARVRGVLTLLWGEQAGEIEREACDILGFKTLRDYFRDPRKGFFPFHIKRYSKSRRKAPIYWLLQSEQRNYGIWLYIHRMDTSALYTAAREYADPKVALEEARLHELRAGLEALSGAARRGREREIERQIKIVEEVTAFRNELDRVALLNLPPDLNDGVVIGIAPLHALVPWKEAEEHWKELVAGEYEWSTMSQQMRKRGLAKA